MVDSKVWQDCVFTLNNKALVFKIVRNALVMLRLQPLTGRMDTMGFDSHPPKTRCAECLVPVVMGILLGAHQEEKNRSEIKF